MLTVTKEELKRGGATIDGGAIITEASSLGLALSQQFASTYFAERCSQWAEQTEEPYRCPEHQQPNPFCNCVDVSGQRINGKLIYDGRWEERGTEIQAARRRFHVWADQQRPEVKTRKQQFKQMIQNKQQEIQCFKEWQRHWAAAGFQTVGHYQGR